MKYYLGLFVFLLSVTNLSFHAHGQQSLGIAATVNDSIISEIDVASRVRLVTMSSGVPKDRKRQQAIASQVLKTLIDEELQIQEAKKLGVEIKESEIREAMVNIAANNKISRKEFVASLSQAGITPDTLEHQIHARLAWQQSVRKTIIPRIKISDIEVNEEYALALQQQKEPQYHLYELVKFVDNPRNERKIEKEMVEIAAQIRKGAKFGGMAQQFSSKSSASAGGNLGMIRFSLLPEQIKPLVNKVKVGNLIGPVRVEEGFGLYVVREKKQPAKVEMIPIYHVNQLLLPLSENPTSDEKQNQIKFAQTLIPSLKTCADLVTLHKEMNLDGSPDLGKLKLADMAQNLKSIVSQLQVNQISKPIPLKNDIALMMVCEKSQEQVGDSITKSDVREQIFTTRIDAMAEKKLRDLRRAAIIDIRR